MTSALSCQFQTVLYFYLKLQIGTNVKITNRSIIKHEFALTFLYLVTLIYCVNCVVGLCCGMLAVCILFKNGLEMVLDCTYEGL